MTTPAVPSWKNPKPLRNALADWASRDGTRPDPKARAAADTALAAIADTIAELAALGLRLEREIELHDSIPDGEIRDDDGSCPVGGCILPGGHFPRVQHVDAAGVIFGTYLKAVVRDDADDDSGYHDAAGLDHDEQTAVPLGAGDGPLSGPQLAVVQSSIGLVHDEADEPGEDGWAVYLACGDSTTRDFAEAMAQEPEPGNFAVCPRHGSVKVVSLAEWTDNAAVGAPVRLGATAP